jgi:hypothetical protein
MASAKRLLSTRKAITGLLAVAALGLTASPALAATNLSSVDVSGCVDPMLTQPFLGWGDGSYYMLPTGESVDDFTGAGWTLTGGASIVSTTLADGTTGHVLDLPGGSSAASPVLCVSSNYPTARTMILGSSGVFSYVSYAGTATWNNPKNTGQIHGNNTSWSLSGAVNLQPYSYSGWQLVRITLTPPPSGDTKLYNFYVDPYAKR